VKAFVDFLVATINDKGEGGSLKAAAK